MIWMMLLFLFQVDATQTQLQFDKGNQKLKEQDYLGAIEQYHQIDTQVWESGALYLNMGLAYTQLDSLGKSKAYFKQALLFESTQTEAQKGLEYVIKRLPQKAASLPKLPWDYIIEWVLAIGSTTWSWTTLVLAYFTVTIFALYLFKLREVKLLTKAVWVGLIGVILFSVAALYSDYVSKRYGNAVLITEQSNLNKAASFDSELISLAFEGYEFTVDYQTSSENPEWMYVRMSNGVYGWIKRSDLITF